MAKDLRLTELILAYREEGLSYSDIAKRTGVSSAYARNICSRDRRKKSQKQANKTIANVCRFCGSPLSYTAGAKKKDFCDDKCRSDYHNQLKKRKPYVCTCKCCGLEFISFGYPDRKYCSRECQNASSRGKQSA